MNECLFCDSTAQTTPIPRGTHTLDPRLVEKLKEIDNGDDGDESDGPRAVKRLASSVDLCDDHRCQHGKCPDVIR